MMTRATICRGAKRGVVRWCGTAWVLALASVPTMGTAMGTARETGHQARRDTHDRGHPQKQVSAPPLQDSALTVGTLPNGLRYYLRVNAHPAHRIEFRFVVNAGSILEDEDQRGFAHFLEHMAFNGTTHFPGTSLVDFIRSAGMIFGGDLNAYTSFDETVYMLTLPTDDSTIVDRGLQVLQDWATGGITIKDQDVTDERGVIMGEWRMRLQDTAAQTAQRHQLATFDGATSRYPERVPIGLTSLIQTATSAPIRRFYHDWYRPDLMAVVVVGDFDKAAMERQIRARFGRATNPASERPRPPVLLSPQTAPVTDVYRSVAVPPMALVYWRQPAPSMDPQTAVRDELLDALVFRHLEQVFLSLRTREHRPFVIAQIGALPGTASPMGRPVGPVDLLQLAAAPDSLQAGLVTALTEIERIAQHGLPATTLAAEKAALLSQAEHDAAHAWSSGQLADRYRNHFLNGGGLLLSDAQILTATRAVLPTITSAMVAQRAAFWRSRRNRTVLYYMPAAAHVTEPTAAQVDSLFDTVAARRLPAAAVESTTTAALVSAPPKPGTIVAERRDTAAGITEWTLSNGARVLYKPTENDADELLINAHAMGGTSLLPDSLFFSSGRLVGQLMTAAAGFGTNADSLTQALLSLSAIRDFHVTLNASDQEIGISGSPRDLPALFQQIYRQFAAPTLDTAALSAWRRYGTQTLHESTNDQLARILARGNPRLAPPSAALVQLIDLPSAMAVYHALFGDAARFTFTIVGAALPDSIKSLVLRYIATLPSSGHMPVTLAPKDPHVPPWSGISGVTQTNTLLPRSQLELLFDGVFPDTGVAYVTERQRLSTVQWVLQQRLLEEVRERLALAYSPSVQAQTYAAPAEHFQVTIGAVVAPSRLDTTAAIIAGILDSLRTVGATPEELAFAARTQQRTLQTLQTMNGWWVNVIKQYGRLGIPLDRIVTQRFQQLTPAAFVEAARQYVPADAYIQIKATPAMDRLEIPETGMP